jgi:hypothetical protein
MQVFTVEALAFGTQVQRAWSSLYELRRFCDVTLLVGQEKVRRAPVMILGTLLSTSLFILLQ